MRSFFNIFESRKDLDDFVKEVVEEEIVNPIKKQAESLSLEEKGKVKKPAEVKAEAEQATPPTTPEILEWDAVTEERFKNWLEVYIPEEDIATVEAGIREYVKDDPDILKTASWNRIRDLAEAEGYMIATKEELETIKRDWYTPSRGIVGFEEVRGYREDLDDDGLINVIEYRTENPILKKHPGLEGVQE